MDLYYLILVIPSIILSLIAQASVKSTYAKYAKVLSRRGMTGKDAAEQILQANGIFNIRVLPISGQLTDHYSPKEQVIRLSEGIYDGTSVAALGVAAHEVGHAIQYHQSYFPIRLRNAILPVANFGSGLAMPLVIIGLLLSFYPLVQIGILFFGMVVLFQLLTLPVEFNASSRALKTLERGYLSQDELKGTKKVLKAAAMTYVAALATSLAQFLRLILIARGNRRR